VRIRATVLALVLAACGSATSDLAVQTTGAEVSTLTGRETYTHAVAQNAPEGFARPDINPELMAKIRTDIDATMQSKGYTIAPPGTEAKLVVRISTGHRTVEKAPAGRRAAAGASTEETEGALVIDILDRASGKQIFHGFARDGLAGDRVEDSQIADAVRKILDPVPSAQR
jgi:hypothetical protein